VDLLEESSGEFHERPQEGGARTGLLKEDTNGSLRGNSRKAYWRISKSPILHKTLGNSYWNHQGLKSLYEKYCDKRHLFD
jgi:hypothetical protein